MELIESPLQDLKKEVSTGTTIIAVQYQDGVIIGADSRTSSGSYAVNRVTDKLTPVHDYIYCLRSGSAADTQIIASYVSYYLNMFSIEEGCLPTVKKAAHMFREFCYQNKQYLLASIIVAGWDEENGGCVYNVPLGGSIIKQPFAIGGSGSSYLYGYCDIHFKENMTEEEAISFVSKGITEAIARDGSSGGICRIATINKDGVKRRTIYGNELQKFWEK
ncbi:proteasome subunit beta [Anaeramoeba flamelloides]|uniref:Proteasome subunit beta n=1 Tax=Anaeramoeba flamelloides TaxID=1746091 RepID=A0AAV7YPX5_9EUKA|nr:proteasome subunit beta [Anaeramoeba flamelloides]KAJ3452003.1 proteasome subunit beta [Anaeramoeba flamelloides]KAJ6249104.1 proteasome subunit beta [Anaeramoeba flamelloides]KAJ6252710.1 proteasome subunit beta [Anaeramoeba flamelloides]